ncbi:flagellar hook-associated protein FlgL [Bacillus sp. AGMB 02131]|uniref:Flagellar hook-associated protein FlgL n=1 Tax=Peribacillus faecalis TaxID=2772559 RepID=A0A927CVD5_9BACI|nr:flagellar hook-associated protein FlgL [Peribacillus faecalis]MBD3108498.1 flagellar hook-associated protein FlgL [Peribacillus faecalis]
MRVTQSMISNNTLRNISQSYSKLSKLNDQSVSGKKFDKPSDDPVAAMLAMSYRTDLNKIEQFQQNISTSQNWVNSTDDALSAVGDALQKIRELTVQVSNGTLEDSQRSYIGLEIKELKKQISDLADTQVGDKYIFGGTKTDQRPSDDLLNATGTVEIEVFSGITLPLNIEGASIFSDMFKGIDQLTQAIDDPNTDPATFTNFIADIDQQLDVVLTNRAVVGARQNRVDLMESRLIQQEIFSTRILSDNEDVDLERVLIDLTTQESVHRAALGVGAKIMQPTLMDFLR